MQVVRDLAQLPALLFKLLERESEQRVVVGLEPDLAAERQHVCIQRQKARVGQAALVLAGFLPRVGEVDVDARDLAGGEHVEQVDSVPVEKAHVFEPALRHTLHADDHGVRHFFDRGEENIRVLCGSVRREAALAAAEFQLQRLIAGEVLQPVAAQCLGVGDQGGRAALHARQQVLFLSHSHGEIPRFLRSFPAYHSGNAAITQEKNEVFPSAKRNLPQELRYIVRNESILAKNVTKLEIISNEMIFLLQNAGELHIIATLRENKEGIPCLS